MTYQQIQEAVQYIQKHTNNFIPKHGVVLGTGLGGLINEVEIAHTLSYEDIPHFPVSTVETHSGKLHLGTLGDQNVVVMQGRFHHYEGYTMKQVVFPVQVMKLLGIEKLYVSNASGGINPNYEVSDLMIVKDHINLQYENPLRGANIDELGDRFPDMSEPYNFEMISHAEEIAMEHKVKIHKGVYASVPGPNLETRAEYNYLKIIGADNVGMSTVPEVIVAAQMNLPTFAISVITDMCIPATLKKANIMNIISAAAKAEPSMTLLIKELIKRS